MVSDEIRQRRRIGKGMGARMRGDSAERGPSPHRKLSDDDLAAIERSLKDGLTLAAIARAMWQEKGFASFDSAYNCMRVALKSRAR